MKIYLSHSGDTDYTNQLYAPLKASPAFTPHQVFYPHDPQNAAVNTKEALKDFDVVLAEVSYPSTGQGIEIGRAEVYGVPVVCFYKEGAKPSGSLKFVTQDFIPYSDPIDMLQKLEAWANMPARS